MEEAGKIIEISNFVRRDQTVEKKKRSERVLNVYFDPGMSVKGIGIAIDQIRW